MKRRRLSLAVTAISVSALALGLGMGGSASASPTAAAGTAAAAARTSPTVLYGERTVVISCLGQPDVRPGKFTLACADGDDWLTGLSWTSWTPRLASGYGTQVEDDCIPYCAAGHYHSYPVLVVLWGTAALRGDPGTLRYTNMTLLYPGARPEVYNGRRYVEGPAAVTISLWAAPS
jgi:hypothetical protein